MLLRIWKHLKAWRRITVGPFALIFRLDRAVRVTPNSPERVGMFRSANTSQDVNIKAELAGRLVRIEQPARIALIVGVGPGFGYALALRLARDGLFVVLASRNAAYLDLLVDQIRRDGGRACAYGCDATMERSVRELFALVEAEHGVPHLVVYSVQHFGPGQTIDIEVPAFEDSWRHNCLGAFLVARAAGRVMLPKAEGTVLLVGSTSSLLGRAGHLNLAVGKFGQRALAQVLARELWPRGIHVAHVVIDADIDEGDGDHDGQPHSDPHHIAQVIMDVYRQPKTAWSSEVDVRPWNERFWEHC
jgi:NAD(P)-dependent dehydrogenase (short-subunit alcohol dehydrogenase family)